MYKVKRLFSLCMILIICVTLFPAKTVEAAGTLSAVYVDENGADSNGGTSVNDAVKTINKAVELAAENAVIYVSGGVLVDPLGGTDDPFVIDKQVTIQGPDANNLASISVRAGGILLGADVTFRNVTLGGASFIRPGVATNGHALTLINVQQDPTLRPLQIYGGTFSILKER